jgi:hypothetical protein
MEDGYNAAKKNLNLNPLDDMWGGKIKPYLICRKGRMVLKNQT